MQFDVILTDCDADHCAEARALLVDDSINQGGWTPPLEYTPNQQLESGLILSAMCGARLLGSICIQSSAGCQGWLWAPALSTAMPPTCDAIAIADQLIRGA